MSVWCYSSNKTLLLNETESRKIEMFKHAKSENNLFYVFEDIVTHENTFFLTSDSRGFVKKECLIPIEKVKCEFARDVHVERHEGLMKRSERILCKDRYIASSILAESFDEMIFKYGPERTGDMSGLYKNMRQRLDKRSPEHILSPYVICFTGVPEYSSVSELCSLVSKFGGMFIKNDDTVPRPKSLFANKYKLDMFDFTNARSMDKSVILVRGYDMYRRTKENYPYLILSANYNTFQKYRNPHTELVVDEYELLDAIVQRRSLVESKHLLS
jgi:hypothetical protein